MNVSRNKLSNLKIKALSVAIFLFLVSSLYAIPFETARNLGGGRGELMLGFSTMFNFALERNDDISEVMHGDITFGEASMPNLSFKGNFGITDHFDLGFGIDLPFVGIYLSGKRKLLPSGGYHGFDLFLSGAYGITDTDTPYCHCTLLAGLNYKGGECFTFGAGVVRDPRLTFNPFALGVSDYSRDFNPHILLGLSNDIFIGQAQFVFDLSDEQDKIKIILGLGIRSIRFLE